MTKLYILNGPNKGQSFTLGHEVTYVGRSSDNDIQIKDKTVSRRHLKIIQRENRYFVMDLKSRNGTFSNGKYLTPNNEHEIKSGDPVAIGMSIIGIGDECIDQILPFLDSVELTQEISAESGIFKVHKDRSTQKKLELLYNASGELMKNYPIKETLGKIIVYVFRLLEGIDRVAFILLDPETGGIKETIFKTKKGEDDADKIFCQDVLMRVLHEREPLLIPDAFAELDDDLADTVKVEGIGSVMCIPLISSSKVLGAMYIDSLEKPYGFQSEDLSLFIDLCQQAALSIEKEQLECQL